MTIYSLFVNLENHLPDNDDVFSGNTSYSLADILDQVKKGQQLLQNFSIDDIITFFTAVASEWSRPQSDIQKKYARFGLNFLIYWMREKYLKEISDMSLHGNRLCMDNFVQFPYSTHQFLANPRGIICHWLAGNVPTLGILSLIQGMLTKNGNILKVSRQNGHVLPNLIASMSIVECKNTAGETIHGKDILRSVAAIYFDSDQKELQQQLSKIANVRVAWGGKEAVESIMNTPKAMGTEDVIFGPKISFMVIGKEALSSEKEVSELAKRASTDISAFEQRGCNSPHTVFVEKGGFISPKQFAELLSIQMDLSLKRYPKEELVQAGDSIKIVSLRTKYDMCGEAYYPKGLEWSVLYSDNEKGLATPCFNRTVFIRAIDDITEIEHYCSHQTQSAGVALSSERKLEFAKRVSRKGIDRIPDVGAMTAHEVPWDGLFLMDRFVRWCRI